MVSFQCENCGDVFTKKKLDQHYNRCYGQFTCLDCMTTFGGTSYRSHTACISEDQKYQGALYKEKPKNHNKKTVNIVEPHEERRQPYVEDAPEPDEKHDNSNAVAIVKAPPSAPSPPPSATMAPKPNVFDFLVDEDTPNASRVELHPAHEPMQMVAHAPAIFRSHSNSPSSSRSGDEQPDRKMIGYNDSINSNGFAYGAGPVPVAELDAYRTPAPKESRRRQESPSSYAPEVVQSLVRKSTDKKRKRQVEDLDLTRATQYQTGSMEVDYDDPNFIAPPLQHSGLTGGLSRMLSKSGRDAFPPSPASDIADETPLNLSKTRRDRERKARGREARLEPDTAEADGKRGRRSGSSGAAAAAAAAGALIKVHRSRRTSDESRPRKHHRSHRHRSDEHPDRERQRRASGDSGKTSRSSRQKAIEYNVRRDDSDDEYEDVDEGVNGHHRNGHANGQMVLYGQEAGAGTALSSRANLFLSFITKGPDSEKGCSMNKALKRYHRERTGDERARRDERERDKMEDEKELWKSLRLKKNDRGEFVLFVFEGAGDD